MNDLLHLVYSFPNDVVAFRVRMIFKGIGYVFQIVMQDGDPSVIKKFVESEGKLLDTVYFGLTGRNILFFDDRKNEYTGYLRISRKVFSNGCEPMHIRVKSDNIGEAEICVTLYCNNAAILRNELFFSVLDPVRKQEQ